MKKYQIIYKDLEKAIHDQKYQVGDFLPTEQELVQSYQVSRDTIRKALTLLVEEGLVKKIHGSGSQVINQEQINFPVSDLTSPNSQKELVFLIADRSGVLFVKESLIAAPLL